MSSPNSAGTSSSAASGTPCTWPTGPAGGGARSAAAGPTCSKRAWAAPRRWPTFWSARRSWTGPTVTWRAPRTRGLWWPGCRRWSRTCAPTCSSSARTDWARRDRARRCPGCWNPGEIGAEQLLDPAQQPGPGGRGELGDVGLTAFLGHPGRRVHLPGPWHHDPHTRLEQPGAGDAFLAPVRVAVMPAVARADRLHHVLVGVEPVLPVRPGVAPPGGPAPARPEHPRHLPAGVVLVEPVPGLGEAGEVDRPGSDRQPVPVRLEAGQAGAAGVGPAQHELPEVDRDRAGPAGGQLPGGDAGARTHVEHHRPEKPARGPLDHGEHAVRVGRAPRVVIGRDRVEGGAGHPPHRPGPARVAVSRPSGRQVPLFKARNGTYRGQCPYTGTSSPRAIVWKRRLKPVTAGDTSELMSRVAVSRACTANT